jgi:hypothetical protein
MMKCCCHCQCYCQWLALWHANNKKKKCHLRTATKDSII